LRLQTPLELWATALCPAPEVVVHGQHAFRDQRAYAQALKENCRYQGTHVTITAGSNEQERLAGSHTPTLQYPQVQHFQCYIFISRAQRLESKKMFRVFMGDRRSIGAAYGQLV
jgi:hypothetical protein